MKFHKHYFLILLFISASMANSPECISSHDNDSVCIAKPLWPGWGSIRSQNGYYEAVMQNDGNFVIYKNDGSDATKHPKAIWNAGTIRSVAKRPFILRLQKDGNFVMYSSDKKLVWHTHTFGKGQGPYRLIMQNDANLVLYDRNNKPIWYSNTRQ